MMSTRTIEDVRREIEALRLEQMSMEAAHFKQSLIPQLSEMVGSTFVYRDNSYGSGGRWDEWCKVLGVVFSEYHAHLICEQCAIDSEGKARIGIETKVISATHDHFSVGSGWTTCPAEKYEAARRAVLAELANPVKCRAHLESR